MTVEPKVLFGQDLIVDILKTLGGKATMGQIVQEVINRAPNTIPKSACSVVTAALGRGRKWGTFKCVDHVWILNS